MGKAKANARAMLTISITVVSICGVPAQVGALVENAFFRMAIDIVAPAQKFLGTEEIEGVTVSQETEGVAAGER